jgi:hypothetical protein
MMGVGKTGVAALESLIIAMPIGKCDAFALCLADAGQVSGVRRNLPLHGKRRLQSQSQWVYADLEF